MGLDMYLEKRTNVKNWSFMKEEEKHQITVKKNKKKHPFIKPKRISAIVEDIMYWRKENHIHKWFVDNVQDGVDDCREAYVDDSKLKELVDILAEIIKEPSKGETLLPTQGGFFFGSTAYDEYYMDSIKRTHKVLSDALNELEEERLGSCFYYSSSW